MRFTPCGAFIAMVSSAGQPEMRYSRGCVSDKPCGLVDVRSIAGLVETSRVDPQAARHEQRADDV